jgi:hypothetical protein
VQDSDVIAELAILLFFGQQEHGEFEFQALLIGILFSEFLQRNW